MKSEKFGDHPMQITFIEAHDVQSIKWIYNS